jgi:hypothetical protein
MKLRITKQLNDDWQQAAEILHLTKAAYLARALRINTITVAGCDKSEPATEPRDPMECVVTIEGIDEPAARCRAYLRYATLQTLRAAPPPLKIEPSEKQQPFEIVEEL